MDLRASRRCIDAVARTTLLSDLTKTLHNCSNDETRTSGLRARPSRVGARSRAILARYSRRFGSPARGPIDPGTSTRMKRIGILTAGGDTPALNAAIHGAVVRANQLRIEIYGLIKGFNCLFNPRVPHLHLNPLFQEIPEIDPTKGGTLIGSSRDYIDPEKKAELDEISLRLAKLGIEGL